MYPDMSPAVRKAAYQAFLWANVLLGAINVAVLIFAPEVPKALVAVAAVVNFLGTSVGFTAKSNVDVSTAAPAALTDHAPEGDL